MLENILAGTKKQLQLAWLQLLNASKEFAIPRLDLGVIPKNHLLKLASLVLFVTAATGLGASASNMTTHLDLEPVAHAQTIVRVKQQAVVAPQPPKSMPASDPIEVQIPSVNIDTAVIPTDLASDGSIAVPDAPDKAGWYDQSPTPGELGPAIIVGHVDYIDNIAVFWRLRYIQPGDEIDVTRADGSIAKFSVDSIEQYSDTDFPASNVYGNIDHAGLRLITCGGTFNESTRHYSDNTVVYATLM